MIISCEQCHKKFEIDSNLIPKNGRLLRCGSCNHEWFFSKEIIEKIKPKKDKVRDSETTVEKKDTSSLKKKEKIEINPNLKKNDLNIDQSSKIKTLTKKKSINFLNIILVFILSIISLILIIDTFKKPISFVIPNIDYILYSLYETLKDIRLFFNDLYN